MFFLDAAVLVGILLTLTKAADLLLRPRQQRRLQALFESATLALSYTSVMAASRRLARTHFWWLVAALALLVPLQMILVLPAIGAMFERLPRPITPEMAGLVVVVVFCAELLGTLPAARVLRWVLRDDSGVRTAIRYGAVVISLVVLTVMAGIANNADTRVGNLLITRLLGLLMLVAGAVGAAVFVAAWLFVFALVGHHPPAPDRGGRVAGRGVPERRLGRDRGDRHGHPGVRRSLRQEPVAGLPSLLFGNGVAASRVGLETPTHAYPHVIRVS